MIENIASICLGAVIGYLVMYFLTRFTSYTPKVLGSLISVILGGTVVGFLGKLSNIRQVFSYYVIGLAIGVIVGIIFYWIKHHRPPIVHT
jgi:uncharacterized membrane-anchored protein YhcB (DUF1043 family)